jgi:hypothetical protein
LRRATHGCRPELEQLFARTAALPLAARGLSRVARRACRRFPDTLATILEVRAPRVERFTHSFYNLRYESPTNCSATAADRARSAPVVFLFVRRATEHRNATTPAPAERDQRRRLLQVGRSGRRLSSR